MSVSQPQRLFSPPSESFSQKWSTSACDSHRTKNETAGLNVNIGPPLNARNSWPRSVNGTPRALPSSERDTSPTLESWPNTET